ncbi:hypothetical protein [Chryseobacterium taiwanense]|uniref:Outer membrane protein beta-barrel domain-containing protein n=1 Tax=Chryseobacterium taiwanense TaxID=363331 RepID=A0A0B4D8Z2_9FLAO|nr:hypothetical protein [Chryseobacterium taiwanense]KIC63166.1 hypothetical protein RM51_08930 [Chryseobacterium taiwanense]
MKTKILLLFLLGCAGMVLGQEKEIKEGGNYYFNYPSKENLKKFKNETNLKDKVEISSIQEEIEGSKFRIQVRKVDDNMVYFVFGKFSESEMESKINNVNIESADVQGIYLKELQKRMSDSEFQKFMARIPKQTKDKKKVLYSLPKDKFKIVTQPLYDRIDWRVGVYTVPFKLRLGGFAFDANVNLGANIGGKIRWDREIENGFAIEPIFGFGLASIKLDESNSNVTTANTNVSAFTVNTGVLFHITNAINVGVTFGLDRISKNDQNNYDWKYNNKGWFGLGINVAFNNQGGNTGDKGVN